METLALRKDSGETRSEPSAIWDERAQKAWSPNSWRTWIETLPWWRSKTGPPPA